jgi:hypothetical protein
VPALRKRGYRFVTLTGLSQTAVPTTHSI